MRSSARSPTPAAVPGCGRLGTWMRIFGGSPFSTSSHSVGVALNSPSRSRPVMSAIMVAARLAVSPMFFPRLRGFGLLDVAGGLAATRGHAFVNQPDRFRKRDGVRRLVAGDRGVDASRGDIGAVASVLDRDAAKGRMIAQRLARIGAEAAAARALCNFFGNQRDGPVQSDTEHLVTGLQAGISLSLAHQRPPTSQT